VRLDAAFRSRCRIGSTPDGRVAMKDEAFCVKGRRPIVRRQRPRGTRIYAPPKHAVLGIYA